MEFIKRPPRRPMRGAVESGVALLLLLGTGRLGAQVSSPEPSAASRRVDALLAEWVSDASPGAAVVVMQGDRIVHQRGYGFADIERRVPITPHTRFLLGSLTKPFTALAVMQLAERGRLSYDDPLRKLLPEFPAWGDTITIRRLLHHTAGLPEYEELFLQSGRVDRDWPRSARGPASAFEPTARDATTLLAQQASLRFSPGSRFEYGNSAYMLLAQIVERASGQRFAEYLADQVFTPAGMSESGLLDERRRAIPNRALSYSWALDGFHEIDYTPFNAIYGEDNVVASATDLAKWVSALEQGRLVPRERLREAWTSGLTSAGQPTGYGYGWGVDTLLGVPLVGHGGSWAGFRTEVRYFPTEGLTVIVLANYSQFLTSWVVPLVAEVYLGPRLRLPLAHPITPKQVAAAVGRYRIAPRYELTLAQEGGRLWLSGASLPVSEVRFTSKTSAFLRENPSVSLQLDRDATGLVTQVTLTMLGGQLRGERIR